MCNSPHMREVRFSQPMPKGYGVVWASDMEMYYWYRESPSHYDGPYADRFHARRGAIHDSKQR